MYPPFDDDAAGGGRAPWPVVTAIVISLQRLLAPVLLYQDLLRRIAVTVGLLAVLRLGHLIPLPGLSGVAVPSEAAASEAERLLQAVMTQSSQLPASLFDLGITPFINASIIIQVAMAVPKWAYRSIADLPFVGCVARQAGTRIPLLRASTLHTPDAAADSPHTIPIIDASLRAHSTQWD